MGTKLIEQPKSRSEASSLHLLLTVLSCFSSFPDRLPHIIFFSVKTNLFVCVLQQIRTQPTAVLSKITQTIRRMRKAIPRCLLGDLLGVNVGLYRFDLRCTRAKERVFCTFYFEFSVHFLF